jgi:hypothetical protein
MTLYKKKERRIGDGEKEETLTLNVKRILQSSTRKKNRRVVRRKPFLSYVAGLKGK